jgi:cation diffusion facilitator family transporter
MKHCCDDRADALVQLRGRQSRVLKLVLAINAAMFLVEVVAGTIGRSSALLGDSLDMLADALVYGVSLYVLDRGSVWRARASQFKGSLMLLLGVGVVIEAVAKAVTDVVPNPQTMGGVGIMALAANVACLVLLRQHREDDINMQSSWICSRNDIIANVAVIGAAFGVRAFATWWPDVLVGAGVATLFIVSALGVLRNARRELVEGQGRSP